MIDFSLKAEFGARLDSIRNFVREAIELLLMYIYCGPGELHYAQPLRSPFALPEHDNTGGKST